MGSVDGLKVRKLLAKGQIGHVITDSPVALRIRNTAKKAVTSVTVTTATQIVLIDADDTTTVSFATDNTLQKVADRINATTNWECKVLDSLGSAASASRLVDGAISASTTDGVTYYDAKLDTSTGLQFVYRLTNDRHVGENKPQGSHRVRLKKITYAVNMGTAAADSVQLWEVDGSTETKLASWTSVDTTETTPLNLLDGDTAIDANEGNDLVVLVKDAATLADATSNFLDVIGVLE